MEDKDKFKLIECFHEKYKNDVILFAKEILGVHIFTPDQIRVLKDYEKFKRLVIPSGHSTGKSMILAIITLHWTLCFLNSKVIATAPTFRQLQTVYYAEVKKWHNNSMIKDLELINFKQNLMTINIQEFEKQWFMLPISPKNPDAMQGQHGNKHLDIAKACEELGLSEINTNDDLQVLMKFLKDNKETSSDKILVLIDEGSGVSDDILQVIEGIDPTKLVIMGNMTKSTGMFYDEAYSRPSSSKSVITLSSYNSLFMSREQIEDMEKRFGKDSDVIRVRLKGLPPSGNNNAVLSRELVEGCIDILVEECDIKVCGLDVARFGDDNTQCYADDKLEFTLSQKSTMESVGYLSKWCRESHGTRHIIAIDSVGIGSGVVDRIREISSEDYHLPVEQQRFPNVDIVEINNGLPPFFNRLDYANLITEMFYVLKEELENKKVSIPNDKELIDDLCSREYKFNSSGKIIVESKEEFKKRLKRSPDKGDAFLMMNFAKKWR